MSSHVGGRTPAPRAGGRGRSDLVRERSPKPRRRFRAGRALATLHLASEALQLALDPDAAAWAALVALTAGEGFAFNRAFLLVAEDETLRGRFAVGPRSREEARMLWVEIRHQQLHPLEELDRPDPGLMAREREKHAASLAALSQPLDPGSTAWRRPFVGRLTHPHPCVRHWVTVLDSPALAVIPIIAEERPWGVLLADNFVTRAAIYPGTLEAAATLANALRVALERTYLHHTLQEEHRRRVAAEHDTAVLETVRTLAHDLKNPLALAGGLALELQQGRRHNREDLHKRLNIIAEAVQRAEERLGELADGLTDRVGRVTPQEVDVAEVVERVVGSFRPLAESRGIRLTLYRPRRTLLAEAEPSLLERCVENLIGNAIQALREAAAIASWIRIALFPDGDWVRVDVADNGPPLPGALRDAPFSGGLSTHRSGTGLGLISVRRLMDAMGGHVEYDEREPGWIRFSLMLRRCS
jgi:signal transduction histidine kinase